MASTPQPQPTPALFFKTMNAYQETEALYAAIQLDLFTAVDEGARDPKAIAAKCQSSERGIRILCDYLTIIGFLTKQNGAYALTPDTATFLSRKSPANLSAAVGFLHSPMITEPARHTTEAVRKGGTAMPQHGTMAPEHPMWIDFARSMAPMMMMPAQAIAGILGAENRAEWKVLDIAAGHGMFGIMLARLNPNARVHALDWPQVLEVAQQNAAKAGVASRYHTIPGSVFDVELGKDYDVVLLTNFLHHFSPETNENLLRKVRSSMKSGGKAVLLEFIPNEDRVSPPGAAAFSMMMLLGTDAGDAYTQPELERMLANSGFSGATRHQLPGGIQTVLVSTAS